MPSPWRTAAFRNLVTLDGGLAQKAAELAARHRLHASDAVSAALTRRFGAALVTLDAEQREQAAAVLPVRTVAQDSSCATRHRRCV